MGATATVLVVDDDEDTSTLLGIMFRRQGFRTVVAGDLAEARAALAKGNISGLVTDIRLPDGDGCALLSGGRPAHLRAALLMSGGHPGGDATKPGPALSSSLAGFDDYVTKPFDARVLVQRLSELLGPAATGAP
jgi:two-component system response regulator GlrR